MSVQTDCTSILDNGGETLDRYTISFETYDDATEESEFFCYGASENPFHGFGQHCGDYSFPDTDENPEIGLPVARHDLPEPVQRLIDQIEKQGTFETVICELCDETARDDESIVTEDGFTVGECCRDELRVTGYTTEHDSETFYYAS